MQITTLNGSFSFRVRKVVVSGKSSNWLRERQLGLSKSYETALWTDFCLAYVTQLSYERTAALVSERMGAGTVSDQHLFHLVKRYGEAIKSAQLADINACKSSTSAINTCPVDLYDRQSEEIIYLSDDVCVPEQKAHRDKVAKEGKERTNTSILHLQTPTDEGDLTYTCIVPARGIDTTALMQSAVQKAYSSRTTPLPIVCISDGARSIKNENKAIFGLNVTHFLDWFHIQQKVIQLMSQIAINKTEKQAYITLINNYLWTGNTMTAILVLKFMIVKNDAKRQELIGYLDKNVDYIIDYERRKQAGKIIGSGRTEKANDCLVAKRQKHKGLAWSPQGSRDLALVAAYHQYPNAA